MNIQERLAHVEARIAALETRWKQMDYLANHYPLGAGYGRRSGWQRRMDRSIKLAKELSRLYRERDSLRAVIRRTEQSTPHAEPKEPDPVPTNTRPVKPLLCVTREEWRKKHPDFKGKINGQPFILRLDPETGATVLVPVEII